jgi:hypothetical protein
MHLIICMATVPMGHSLIIHRASQERHSKDRGREDKGRRKQTKDETDMNNRDRKGKKKRDNRKKSEKVKERKRNYIDKRKEQTSTRTTTIGESKESRQSRKSRGRTEITFSQLRCAALPVPKFDRIAIFCFRAPSCSRCASS